MVEEVKSQINNQINQTNQIQVNQTNQNVLGKWVPVRITAQDMGSGEIYFKKGITLKNGLSVFYPLKTYSIPPAIRIVANESHLEKTESIIYPGIYYYKLNNTIYIGRLSIRNNILNIELLKPKTPVVKPKYHIIIFTLPGKYVGSGAFEESEIISGMENMIWTTKEISSSGSHWVDYYVGLFEKNQETEILFRYAGARSRVRKHVYTLSYNGIKEIIL